MQFFSTGCDEVHGDLCSHSDVVHGGPVQHVLVLQSKGQGQSGDQWP